MTLFRNRQSQSLEALRQCFMLIFWEVVRIYFFTHWSGNILFSCPAHGNCRCLCPSRGTYISMLCSGQLGVRQNTQSSSKFIHILGIWSAEWSEEQYDKYELEKSDDEDEEEGKFRQTSSNTQSSQVKGSNIFHHFLVFHSKQQLVAPFWNPWRAFLKWQPCHFHVMAFCFVLLIYLNVFNKFASFLNLLF